MLPHSFSDIIDAEWYEAFQAFATLSLIVMIGGVGMTIVSSFLTENKIVRIATVVCYTATGAIHIYN